MSQPLDGGLPSSALFTDLYELTMAQAYCAEEMDQPAVFELYFRQLPRERNYLVAAGLADVLGYLERLRFTDDDLAFLAQSGQFTSSFLDRLKSFRFTGDVYALPEGTVVFADEPLIQVVAPIVEAQLVETFILNQIHWQTVAASKAARVVAAAAGRQVVEFGARRAHGLDAALAVARTSYLVGAVGTSLVLAGRLYGIPLFGTMAHSYIQAHDSELAALEAFARANPDTTLLVDTYDTLAGVRHAIDVCHRLGEQFHLRAIRLDSGRLDELAKTARQLLDDAGLGDVRIFASGGLDEHSVAKLIHSGAPIDAFGIGTRLAVADDGPYIDMVYKLVEYAGRPRMKLSQDKLSYPGRKQVFRTVDAGFIAGDVIDRHDEARPGEPLLRPVMRGGRRLPDGRATLKAARAHAAAEQRRLPAALCSLEHAEPPYSVTFSEALQRDLAALRRTVGNT